MMDNYMTEQLYQLISSTNIINGEIHYVVDNRSYLSKNMTTHSESTYVYKIQDDATLRLLSVEHKQD